MSQRPNAVELTVDQACFVAETVDAGSFPWVLAITTPYTDAAQREVFLARQAAELAEMGVVSATGAVNPAVADWIKVVCFPQRWLELRFVGPAGATGTSDLLRGIVARRGESTVVALRNAQLVTLTAMDIADPQMLVPVLCAGLMQRPPARFDEFTLPARVGAKADERLRAGADLAEVVDYLGIPRSARPVVEAVFTGPRSYVEVVAGSNQDGRHTTTEVGMSIVDTTAGRVLVSPRRAFDGQWISTFSSGTDFAIAVAIDQLTASLPDGHWFPGQQLSRDFTTQSS